MLEAAEAQVLVAIGGQQAAPHDRLPDVVGDLDREVRSVADENLLYPGRATH
jgi:hypothetical protein